MTNYARHRLGGSRWLQPLDDGKTVVVLWRYPETGDAVRGDGVVIKGMFWAAATVPDQYVVDGIPVTLIERDDDGDVFVLNLSLWSGPNPPSLWDDCAVISTCHRTMTEALEAVR